MIYLSTISKLIFFIWIIITIIRFFYLKLIREILKKKRSFILIKYFLIQSLGSFVFLYSLWFLRYFIFFFWISIIWKRGLIPFHFWAIHLVKFINYFLLFVFLSLMKIIPFLIFWIFFNIKLFFIFCCIHILFSPLLTLYLINLKLIFFYLSLYSNCWIFFSIILIKTYFFIFVLGYIFRFYLLIIFNFIFL